MEKFESKLSSKASALIKRLYSRASKKHFAINSKTETFLLWLEKFFLDLAQEFNVTVAHEPLMLSVRRAVIGERINSETNSQSKPKSEQYERLLVSTSFWALSIRAKDGVVECFTLPSTELLVLPASELPSRARLKLVLSIESNETSSWTMDGTPVSDAELSTLMRSLLKDVIFNSQGDYDLLPESIRLVSSGLSLSRSVRSLITEKQVLVQKVVSQQESILNDVSREIHDAVLGNVMLLKRSLSGNRRMTDEEMSVVLTEISDRLRDICNDLYPRDLADCGLEPMLSELCENFATRTGCKCEVEVAGDVPKLADEAALHVFRIAQECLNNIAKHASASLVVMRLQTLGGVFKMSVTDDGRGIDHALEKSESDSGGLGTSIIKERAELIDCLYPTKVWTDSAKGKGTTVTLQVMFEAADPHKILT